MPSWTANTRALLAVSIGLSLAPMGAVQATSLDAVAPVAMGDVLGMFFGLVVVVATVLLVGWFYARSRGLRGHAGQLISVVAAQSLGPKERIVLIEIGGKQIVVGMTAAQLQTLHVFDEPIVADSAPVDPTGAFANRLRSLLSGTKK